MKRSSTRSINNDRVVLIPESRSFQFYFKHNKSNDRIWLCSSVFSPSDLKYFQDKGCRTGDGYSLTLRELHRFRTFHNPKLTHLVDRLLRIINFLEHEGSLAPASHRPVALSLRPVQFKLSA